MRVALLAGTAMFGIMMASQADAQAAAATAATGDVTTIGEVVVTAQKRAENVQQVPISVTVVSADQLSRRGTQTVQDLSQASASLEFNGSTGGGAFVRGIGTQSLSAATAQASVSIVLDGVVLGNVNVNDVFDVDHVEVLKGPQGTLFGSSVSAGVLSITSKAPKIGQYSAYVSGEYAAKGAGSAYDRGSIKAAVNLPINDASAVRVAAYAYDNNGLEKNVATGANSNLSNYGFRVRYLNHLTDKLTFNLIGDFSKSSDTDDTPFVYGYAPPNSPLANALAACGVIASARNTTTCDTSPSYSTRTIGGLSAQFDYDFGAATATSISSYRQLGADITHNIIDITPSITQSIFGSQCHFSNCSPIVSLLSGGNPAPEKTNRDLFTQEIRLASPSNRHLEWVLGAYYQQSNYHEDQPSTLTVNIAGGAPAGNVVLFSTQIRASAPARDYAAFGNATYYLGDATRLIFGARYTYSEVSETIANRTLQSINPAGVGVVRGSASTTASAFTWRAGAQHDFTPDTMAYFMASTGYKAPQINDGITTGPVTAIKPERPTSFELGVKQSLLGRRFFANADVFYTNVDQFQTQSCIPDPVLGLACRNINVPTVTTKGIELDVFGKPFTGNSVNISAAYVDAAYPANFYGADGSLLTGQQLNNSPKFKATFSTEQEFPISEHYRGVVGGDMTYRTKQSMYLSALPSFVVPDQVLGNVRAGVRSDKNWSAFFFVRNVGDSVYPTGLYPTQAFHPGGVWHFIDPNSRRVLGVQVEANF